MAEVDVKGLTQGLDDVPVRTLSGQDPELAVRHLAYLQRKQLKRESRRNGNGGRVVATHNFLSNLQEVEADVAYRFTFTVVGLAAAKVVEAVCRSTAALRLAGSGGTGEASAPSGPARQRRCLCEVQAPGTPSLPGQAAAKVAKLAMSALGFEEDVPAYESRQEALSSAVVYTLCIDSVGADGKPNFAEQLEGFVAALGRLRTRTRPKLRPVKAVLLCCQAPEGTSPKSTLESWALRLSDFEQANGDMWKFGPVCLEDADVLHSTFVEMTSARIVHSEATGLGDTRPGEDKDEPHNEAQPDEEEIIFAPSVGHRKVKMTPTYSDNASTCSERERPPCFETEMSGSECSETAMELHKRTFGVVEDLDASPPLMATLSAGHRRCTSVPGGAGNVELHACALEGLAPDEAALPSRARSSLWLCC